MNVILSAIHSVNPCAPLLLGTRTACLVTRIIKFVVASVGLDAGVCLVILILKSSSAGPGNDIVASMSRQRDRKKHDNTIFTIKF